LLRVQSQQLPTESQVLEDEVLPGMESADQPAEEISERHNHGKNCSGMALEGRDYRGRDSIRQWKQEVDTKYRYILQTVNAQTHGDEVTVRARLTGEFPGSPVELDHIFTLSNDKIASLEIRS
jgi:hypothetical protein